MRYVHTRRGGRSSLLSLVLCGSITHHCGKSFVCIVLFCFSIFCRLFIFLQTFSFVREVRRVPLDVFSAGSTCSCRLVWSVWMLFQIKVPGAVDIRETGCRCGHGRCQDRVRSCLFYGFFLVLLCSASKLLRKLFSFFCWKANKGRAGGPATPIFDSPAAAWSPTLWKHRSPKLMRGPRWAGHAETTTCWSGATLLLVHGLETSVRRPS